MSQPEEITDVNLSEDNKAYVLGIFDQIDEEAYHSSPGISKHGLDLLSQSPMHYKQQHHEETKALIYGGAFHCMCLEPDLFSAKYVVNRAYKDFRTKESKAWRDEVQEAGIRVISVADHDAMNRMLDAIRAHPIASILLDPECGTAEQSAYWIDDSSDVWGREEPTKRLCRCRPDFVNEAHRLIIDLKTTQNASPKSFTRDIVNYRYHVQAAFYLDGLRQVGLDMIDFKFVAIEKTPPYAIGIYDICLDDRALARTIYKQELKRYHECMTNNEWPGYPMEIMTLELPNYARFNNS